MIKFGKIQYKNLKKSKVRVMIEEKKFWRNIMSHIKFDYSKVLDKFVAPHELDYMQPQVTAADSALRNGTGPGAEMTGWLNLPEEYDKDEFARIQKAAAKIQSDSEVLIVIGIGGSYLGARAAIDPRDQTIEAIESVDEHRIIGLQWHPEFLVNEEDGNLELFEYLLNEL